MFFLLSLFVTVLRPRKWLLMDCLAFPRGLKQLPVQVKRAESPVETRVEGRCLVEGNGVSCPKGIRVYIRNEI